MSLERYYRSLGLPVTATLPEVRKRYRQLAMQYHPDKNPTKGAEKKFMIVTEAYEILTGKRPAPTLKPREKRTSSTKRQNSAAGATAANKSNEERVREARNRFEDQRKREQIENENYYKRLTTGAKWKTIRISAIIGFILASCMALDRVLPHHFEEDTVTHYALNHAYAGNGDMLSIVRTERGHDYWISHINYTLYGRHPKILTETSWIFHEPVKLISTAKIRNVSYNVHYSFYSNFILIIALFLVPVFTFFYKRKTITFTVLFQSTYFVVIPLYLYFIFADDHWAHLLTLGFF